MYRINLLPLELQSWNNQVERGRLIKVALITMVTGCFVLSVLWAYLQFMALKAGLADAEQRLAQLNPAAQEAMAARTQLEQYIQAAQTLEALQSEKYWHGPLLMALGAPMPADVWLEELQVLNYNADSAPDPGHPGQTAAPGGRNTGFREAVAAGLSNIVSREAVPLRPNYVIIKGGAGSVPSAGIYLCGLKEMDLFDHLELTEIREGADTGYQYWDFIISGFLKPEVGPGAEEN